MKRCFRCGRVTEELVDSLCVTCGDHPETVSPVDHGRFGEAYLCQFPDERCDGERFVGTGYCVGHLAEMRLRRVGVSSEVLAEAARLESLVQKDEEAWTRAFQLTNPIDAFAGETQ